MTTRLRYRITIYSESSDDGSEVPAYATKFMAEVPCDIAQVSGGETYRGRQIEATATHMISFRYLQNIVPTMRFTDGDGVSYDVVKVTPRSGRRHMLDCQCTEVVL